MSTRSRLRLLVVRLGNHFVCYPVRVLLSLRQPRCISSSADARELRESARITVVTDRSDAARRTRHFRFDRWKRAVISVTINIGNYIYCHRYYRLKYNEYHKLSK